MGLWEGPGRIFSSSRFSTALWIPCGIVFGAFWGALGTMSASVGTKNTIRNQYQFEFLVDFGVPWERFWVPFGHLFGHGCESENNAGAYTGARFSRFRGVGIGPFWRPCANVVLRDLFWKDLNQFRSLWDAIWAPISRKTRTVLRRSAPQSRTCMETDANGWKRMETVRKPSQGGCQSLSKRQGIWLDLLYIAQLPSATPPPCQECRPRANPLVCFISNVPMFYWKNAFPNAHQWAVTLRTFFGQYAPGIDDKSDQMARKWAKNRSLEVSWGRVEGSWSPAGPKTPPDAF